ncbi:hypothetical protein [uncultured Ferrimonas sp.]|uniref:hypothetical protein n=1 Tax=uncultured Ferrimonas sp. TaxID=432640 RepID=UPI00260D99ED|nr:hypothetical protein [uncultured Ferrimonas sp.]
MISLALLAATGCSNNEQQRQWFHAEVDSKGITHFQLNYFGAEHQQQPTASTAPAKSQSRPQSAQGQRRNGSAEPAAEPQTDPVPRYNQLTNPHFMLDLLEAEFERRQLCLGGYQISAQRPTQRGMVLFGQCPPTIAMLRD